MRKKTALEKKMEQLVPGTPLIVSTAKQRMDAHNWAKKFGYEIRTGRRIITGVPAKGFEVWRLK